MKLEIYTLLILVIWSYVCDISDICPEISTVNSYYKATVICLLTNVHVDQVF